MSSSVLIPEQQRLVLESAANLMSSQSRSEITLDQQTLKDQLHVLATQVARRGDAYSRGKSVFLHRTYLAGAAVEPLDEEHFGA